MPALISRRNVLGTLLAVSAFAGVYLLVSKLTGSGQLWSDVRRADPAWLLLAGALELLSLAGYMLLFSAVVTWRIVRIDWKVSVLIPLAGIAALRLLATGGAGGFAVQAWALSRAGTPNQIIAERLVTNVVIQYATYLTALAACGFGLWTGLLPGGGPIALTLVPAALSVAVIAGVAGLAVLPGPAAAGEAGRPTDRAGRMRHGLAVAYAAVRSGTRSALALMLAPRPGLVGVVLYWGCDVAVLWAAFRVFGTAPAVPIVVTAYFVGTLGDLLPFPGGIGGVDGGMIGVLLAFGTPSSRAVAAVLVYRALSFWLPTLPGIAGWFALRSTVRGWLPTPADPAEGRPGP